MIQDILLGIAFLISATVAATVVPSLPLPLAFLPLMLATGLLVMHRVGSIPGVLWIIFGAGVVEGIGIVEGALLPSMLAAAAGAILVERVFAARSVYALLGLGASTGLVLMVATLLVSLAGELTGSATRSFAIVLGQSFWEFALLVSALYAGFVLTASAKRVLHQLFVIR